MLLAFQIVMFIIFILFFLSTLGAKTNGKCYLFLIGGTITAIFFLLSLRIFDGG